MLWQIRATKPHQHARTVSAETAGSFNAVIRKAYLDDQYQAARFDKAMPSFAASTSLRSTRMSARCSILFRSIGAADNIAARLLLIPDRLAVEGRVRYNSAVPRRSSTGDLRPTLG